MTIKISITEAGPGAYQYAAIDDDTYDGHGSLIGFGETPKRAEIDLLSQMADRNDLICCFCGYPRSSAAYYCPTCGGC